MLHLLFALLPLYPHAAEARPTAARLTCAQARALVQTRGAVVMNYGYHPQAGWLYDRYVKDAGYCEPGEGITSASVTTRDQKSCVIGFTCISVHD